MDTTLTDATGTPRRPADTPAVDPLFVSNYSLDEPTYDEAQAEWWRFYQIPQDQIDPGGEHAGQFVACFDGVIRGYDPSEVTLRTRVAAELGVHPARLAVSYLDCW
jgi:hypothetical protein